MTCLKFYRSKSTGITILNISKTSKILMLIIAIISVFGATHLRRSSSANEVETEHVAIATELPDFANIADVNEKKLAFFDYIRPYIDQKNQAILKQREFLIQAQTTLQKQPSLSSANEARLKNIAAQYRVQSQSWGLNEVEQLLSRVDVIPSSLVLIQAANESGWGTSRFAKQANNFFGQWCYTQGCGLVPQHRAAGMTHEVAKFDSVGGSVTAYFNNLNSNPAYEGFRELRANLRAQNTTPTAEQLIHGLGSYSERKDDYINDILSMLRQNQKLLTFDRS